MTNARFEDLEKRVAKIKRKKYAKFVLIIATICVAIFFYFKETNKPEVKQEEPVKEIQKKIPLSKVVKKVVKKEQKKEEVIAVKKKQLIEKEIPYDTIKLSPNINLDINKTTAESKEVSKESIVKAVEKEKPSKVSKKIVFSVREVKNEEALLERFRAAGDFTSAISLANLYFKDKKYEKSIYWSKKASKLSSSDSSSWIIYAKSKYSIAKKMKL